MDAILYACPDSETTRHIESYYEQCRIRCGHNTAHRYMPHVTLTGFIPLPVARRQAAIESLCAAMAAIIPAANGFQPPVIHATRFADNFHFIPINAPDWEALAHHFRSACLARIPDLSIRVKTDLHVSLAYDFSPTHAGVLQATAKTAGLGHLTAVSSWNCCLYTRQNIDDVWEWQLLDRQPLT